MVQDLQTYRIAPELLYIHRLTFLGIEAQRQGHGVAFARAVSSLIFGGTKDWHQGEHLALAAMDASIADPASHLAEVEANQSALAAAGHWGVPTFVLNGEPFFGEDRIDTLRWRLAQAGFRRG